MQIIDDVKSKGGKILLFTSYCGGLPAPDSNNNPLGYKFSWSARGVLLASTNNAIFLQDGTATPRISIIQRCGALEHVA
jgi:saccharopine dehydrogenase-like NADP-dependent oxidoreductase